MNEIARVAGVSKGTLYVYFDSKETLFEALTREEKREQAEQTCRFDQDHGDVRTTLSSFGFRLLDRMLRPSSIAHLRTVAAVSAKFPRIGQAYYEAGPKFGMERLAAYLRTQAAAGHIAAENFEMAAHHFTELCKSYHLTRAIFGVGEPPGEAELKAHVANAVDVFLRAYGRTP
jgi:AcrR family transcriptional regulator